MAKRTSMEGSEEEEHGDHPGGFQRVGKVAAGSESYCMYMILYLRYSHIY